MINIIGLLLIVIGFLLPYLSKMQVPFIPFFWLGGLLLLNKGIVIENKLKWHKWGQIGILINIALVLGNLAKSVLIRDRSITTIEYWFSNILYWISSPATAIGQQIFPYPETHYPDGSVGFQISYSQTAITAFLDVAIFVMLSAVIAIFWKKRKWKKQNSEQRHRADPV